MNIWGLAVAALLPGFAVPVMSAIRGRTADRLAAALLASSVASVALVLMTFEYDQPSFIDIALGLQLMTVPGTLVLTSFLERWL